MKRLILASLLAVGVSGEAKAYDTKGQGFIRAPQLCSYYLDAYSKTTLKGERGSNGPHEWWISMGWIDGFISGHNISADNGKFDIVAGMIDNDIYRWIASWCRDNMSKDLGHAVTALIRSRK